MTKTAALIVAAGRGSRMGGTVPKQYQTLAGRAVLAHTISAFLNHAEIDLVQVVIHPDDEALYREAIQGIQNPALRPPCHGDTDRQGSVFNGLKALASEAISHILIHDAARPLIGPLVISKVIAALADNDGALAALPINDTVKKSAGKFVADTLDRSNLWRAQTPQGFHFEKIIAAHQASQGQNLTDDVSVAEAADLKVALVEGDPLGFKLTTPEDTAMAEKLLRQNETRMGQGFDVHRFEAGDHVTLCGVDIPHTHKLKGHSDADVAMHALTDAILGAIGEGDIGDHFPPSDPQWKGVASEIFLQKAMSLVQKMGGRLINCDITLICESPKIGPHREAMRRSLSQIMDVGQTRISVKATTTEQLGFTGRGEGIAAQAIATIQF